MARFAARLRSALVPTATRLLPSAVSTAHLSGWKNLERLNLRGTKVTSKVFDHLTKLTALRELDLSSSQIDDEGFENLAALGYAPNIGDSGNHLNEEARGRVSRWYPRNRRGKRPSAGGEALRGEMKGSRAYQ
ncbi:MAG: hypothetical protein EXQ52_14705 [Bryobacterales bacterium]|nr:hypothetical protein [Bryobacterales bacterium]